MVKTVLVMATIAIIACAAVIESTNCSPVDATRRWVPAATPGVLRTRGRTGGRCHP